MNIYRVDGIRHQAVAFGATPEEAVPQALASGEVGDWEAPEAKFRSGQSICNSGWR